VEGARANAVLVDAVREGTRVLQELTAATPIGQVEKVSVKPINQQNARDHRDRTPDDFKTMNSTGYE
jgi:hypothetical protein